MQVKENTRKKVSAEVLLLNKIKDDALVGRAIKIREFCKHRLGYIHSNGLFRFFNNHGIIHSENILKIMDEILTIASKSHKVLNEYEIFLLYISAYCHDLGLLKLEGIEDFDNIEKCNVVRATHCQRVVKYLEKNWRSMGLLNETEAMVLSNICQAHGSKQNLKNLQEINHVLMGDNNEKKYLNPVRERLLAAILRLADALDADESRLPYEACRENDLIPFVQQIEYYKHELVDGVFIEPKEKIIYIHLKMRYENPIDPYGSKIDIVTLVRDSVRKECDSVKDILCKDFLKINGLKFPVTQGPYLKTRPKFRKGNIEILEPVDSPKWLVFQGCLPSQKEIKK